MILSGGAINSPQLLMLSGVGNADDLKQLGIPVIQHLPGAMNVFAIRDCRCWPAFYVYVKKKKSKTMLCLI